MYCFVTKLLQTSYLIFTEIAPCGERPELHEALNYNMGVFVSLNLSRLSEIAEVLFLR